MESGKGYLRLNKNLFIYDPTVENGNDVQKESASAVRVRRSDFDESRLAKEFNPTYLGTKSRSPFSPSFEVNRKERRMSAIRGRSLDRSNNSEHSKTQDRALSGRLMRTSYYPSWQKLMSPSKGSEIYLPKQIHIFDEVEKANQTQVIFKDISPCKRTSSQKPG